MHWEREGLFLLSVDIGLLPTSWLCWSTDTSHCLQSFSQSVNITLSLTLLRAAAFL